MSYVESLNLITYLKKYRVSTEENDDDDVFQSNEEAHKRSAYLYNAPRVKFLSHSSLSLSKISLILSSTDEKKRETRKAVLRMRGDEKKRRENNNFYDDATKKDRG